MLQECDREEHFLRLFEQAYSLMLEEVLPSRSLFAGLGPAFLAQPYQQIALWQTCLPKNQEASVPGPNLPSSSNQRNKQANTLQLNLKEQDQTHCAGKRGV